MSEEAISGNNTGVSRKKKVIAICFLIFLFFSNFFLNVNIFEHGIKKSEAETRHTFHEKPGVVCPKCLLKLAFLSHVRDKIDTLTSNRFFFVIGLFFKISGMIVVKAIRRARLKTYGLITTRNRFKNAKVTAINRIWTFTKLLNLCSITGCLKNDVFINIYFY